MPRRLHAAIAGYPDSYLAPSTLQCQREAAVGFASLRLPCLCFSMSCFVSFTLDCLPASVGFSCPFSPLFFFFFSSSFIHYFTINSSVTYYLIQKNTILLSVFLFNSLSTSMHFQFDVDLVPADLSLLRFDLPITTPGAFTISISHSLG